jgi:hypothetical protein
MYIPTKNTTYASTLNSVVLPISSNNLALNSSIIGRIHTAKPGCSSCGRK